LPSGRVERPTSAWFETVTSAALYQLS